MSDDYQIRKDIDRAKLFLNNLEEVLEVKYGLTAQDIKELFSMYYDKSEVYSKSEIDSRLTTWKRNQRRTGIVLYRNPWLKLCELRLNREVGTLDTGKTFLVSLSSYSPTEYVISPVLGYNDVVVYCGGEEDTRGIRIHNYGSQKTDVTIRATLFWRYE